MVTCLAFTKDSVTVLSIAKIEDRFDFLKPAMPPVTCGGLVAVGWRGLCGCGRIHEPRWVRGLWASGANGCWPVPSPHNRLSAC